jgi:Flp pilus assembly pilin Flp
MFDRIFKSEDGPGPVEYALMLAILIALGVGFVGTNVPSNQSNISKSPISKTSPEVKVGNLPESATNR